MSRSQTDELFSGALDEVRAVLEAGASEEVDALCAEILKAKRIATYGVGREGLMMRAFCMRLMHLGLDAHVVGEMTTPHLGKGDLLFVSAGPGWFSTVAAIVGVARNAGARTAAITAQTMADDRAAKTSVLPMGSLYEAAMLIFFDIVSIVLRKRTGQSGEDMRGRHTNLE